MLTAKGIGGGSAKVTNGILQEMYAAEGEIPAGTFVDVRENIVSSENEESIVILGSNSLPTANYRINHVAVGNADLLTYVSSTTSSISSGAKRLNVTVKYQKLEGDVYVDMPTVEISSGSITMSGSKINTGSEGSDHFHPIAIGSDKILFMDYCYFDRTSSSKTGQLAYFVLNVSAAGALTVPSGESVKLLELITTSSYLEGFGIKAHRIDASTIACIACYRTYSISGTSVSNLHNTIEALKLSLSSNNVLSQTAKTNIFSHTLPNSSGYAYMGVSVVSVAENQNTLIMAYLTPYASTSDRYYYMSAIALDSWTKVSVKKDGTELKFKAVCRIWSIQDSLIIFSQADKTSISADVFEARRSGDNMSVTLLNSLENLQNNNPIGSAYVNLPDDDLDGNRFILSSKSISSHKVRTLKLLEFKDKVLSETTGWFNVPNTVPTTVSSGNFYIYQAVDGLLAFLDYDLAVVCSFGEFQPFAYLPSGRLKGLTKTKCTKTKKGQVWLLNTQEGE